MLHSKSSKKVFIKPVIPPKDVAIFRDQRVAGLMNIEDWKSVGEILQIYKLPYERK